MSAGFSVVASVETQSAALQHDTGRQHCRHNNMLRQPIVT